MVRAVYPGSFDPITLGHVDIIRRLQSIFGGLTILISENVDKKTLFTSEERKFLIEEALGGLKNVQVVVHQGLTVDFMRDIGANVIVRGLRAVADFEFEMVRANMNKKLAPGIDTMIVFASPEFYYVASSIVKEVAFHGGSISGLVPDAVEKALYRKFPKTKIINKFKVKKNISGKKRRGSK